MRHNVLIKFHGMRIKGKPKQLNEYLEALLRHSPSNSTCRLHLFKEEHNYLCKLTVHSNIKTFSAQDKSKSIGASIRTTLRNVKKQIATWKKKRTSFELTGVHSVTDLVLSPLEGEEVEGHVEKKVA